MFLDFLMVVSNFGNYIYSSINTFINEMHNVALLFTRIISEAFVGSAYGVYAILVAIIVPTLFGISCDDSAWLSLWKSISGD